MRVLSFSGTPRAIGRAFGETCRGEIDEFYRLRVGNAIGQAARFGGRDVSETTLLDLARASLEDTRKHHPEGYDELAGIAEGANKTVAEILAMNGLTDFRDVLAWNGDLETFGGCTSFVVQRDRTRDGQIMCGQTWDLATDNMPFVVGVHRRPERAPETWSLTTVGCLSLIGINEARICVGTTNLRTVDSRAGVTYLSMIHKALAQRDFESAIAAVVDAKRSGAHYYYVADAEGRAAALECSPSQCHRIDIVQGSYVHCNHCLVPANAALEGETPAASSHARQTRLETLLEDAGSAISAEMLRTFLADRENGRLAICRDDFDGISSNGAVVMAPEQPAMWACHGLPDRAPWIDLRKASG